MGNVVDIRTRREIQKPPQMRVVVGTGTDDGDECVYMAISEPSDDEGVGMVVGMSADCALELATKLRKTVKALRARQAI